MSHTHGGAAPAGRGQQVRCAIYTRKSSDEGLEQAFNSLDAQREACAAYILSQASEGWSALPEVYDDGGLSGGTLERPALRRLLAEVAAGRVDIIVVYKVDRLTRSLFDFAKLVETFDAAGTSFVSVTQSFNTTTSMGRLTLNMLLSFAQFEREVTAERIRDKIAASKARGMWMGGTPPLGYSPDGRSLAIVEEHASLVRQLFERYLALGSVRLLQEELGRTRVTLPARATTTGKPIGGGAFSRGQLYHLLGNVTYTGQIGHKGKVYPGLHQPIVDQDLWDRVQAMLAGNVRGERRGERAVSPSLLAGKVVDGAGQTLATSHACKPVGSSEARRRYRYYVSRDAARGAGSGMRIPAGELETAVSKRAATLFDDGLALIATTWLEVTPSRIGEVTARCTTMAARLNERSHGPLRDLVEQVRVRDSRIEIDCSTKAIAVALQVERSSDAPATITLSSDVRLTRSGMAMRLVHDNGAAATGQPNVPAVRLLVKARRWWARLRAGDIDVTRLAQAEGVNPAYVTRVLRLAFLSPAVVEAILTGKAAAHVDAGSLVATGGIAASWAEQARVMLPAR